MGGKCLKWWKIGAKIINGCTTKPDPNGGNSGREWCRTEKDLDNNIEWAWCSPELDFD